MSSIPLSEQLRAMAFVDELRHQQKQVQEHLDLPRRRAEIAERIRAYYLSNNIAFDDDLIEQGVRQVFAHRLMFEAPPLNGFDAWLVKTLTHRSKMRFWSGFIAMFLAAFMVAFVMGAFSQNPHFGAIFYSDDKIREVARAAAEVRSERRDLYKEIDKQRRALIALQNSNVQQPDAYASQLLERAQKAMPISDVRTEIGASEPVSRANVAVIEPQVNALKAEKNALNRALYSAETDIKYARGILEIRQGVKEMLQDPRRAAALAQFSDLDGRLAELDQQLKHVNSFDSHMDASSTYRELSSDLWPDKDLLELQSQRAYELKTRLAEKSVPEEIREELQVKMREIDAELKKGDSDAAEKKISHLTKQLKAAGYWTR
ncbi:hypothetical protein PMI21_03014 [Pseudomonas sp. GM18]|uniref:DUF6384 family protein n=1 Tax=Pseudomonas sp. GM18 TaxID=1144324 RepID=UPI0002728163|nr:DUF6384 family protein [Pseudomonas sp. GM18]EJM16266.1 hypothetical protein PMI21_03014 [Pseudomonas sp. GM18]